MTTLNHNYDVTYVDSLKKHIITGVFTVGAGGRPTVSFEVVGSQGRSRRYIACPYYYEDAQLFKTRCTDNFVIDTDGIHINSDRFV